MLCTPLLRRAITASDATWRQLRSRPLTVAHRGRSQLRRIDGDVADALALPCVSDVDQAVPGLDDGRVRVLAGLVLEHDRGLPARAVARHCDVQRRSPSQR